MPCKFRAIMTSENTSIPAAAAASDKQIATVNLEFISPKEN